MLWAVRQPSTALRVRSRLLRIVDTLGDMTTKAELHELVERLQPGVLDDVAVFLRQFAREPAEAAAPPPYPRSVGILSGAPADLSRNVDDYLAEGFGR